jgi:hypothetical protein
MALEAQETNINDSKIVIITNPFCIKCKLYVQTIDGLFNYEIIELNKKNTKQVMEEYKIEDSEEFPLYILMYKGEIIYSTNEPISPMWANHILKYKKEKN